ncbi:aminotransferase class I/II-fold pyridoxal phosphate-dependent enzyme, partial [Thermodesulfitimonas autotrophica]|uniref:aminotransferase class I/II-fold pyridoxal phosphate-dependent enzyme n=1 Tax=Thermodesulfitimonas autotrophica TaxID=1894989 RepID=UPI002FE39BFC
GDIPPLPEFYTLAQEFEALLIVDDAHGTGVLGPNGRGTVADAGIPAERIVISGTLSKALASLGGFVTGPGLLSEFLLNRARSFIFTTALPPVSAAAALAALEVLEAEPAILEGLWENVMRFRQGLNARGLPASGNSPIIPLILGSPERALRAAENLLEQGYYVPAIRPPAVPPGTARLRITVSAAHTPAEIDGFLNALGKALEEA